jgi:hypothetical protein
VEALSFDPIVNVSLEDFVAFDLVFVAMVGVGVVAKEHSDKVFPGEQRKSTETIAAFIVLI